MTQSRLLVANALLSMQMNDGYSNIVIDKALFESELSSRDKAFASNLFYGVIERRITLDYIMKKYIRPKLRIKAPVKIVLRMGIYQLLYMNSVPDSAAVNESVKLVRELGQPSASGLVNAVLRSFLRDEKKFILPDDKITALSIKYSCDKTLVSSLIDDYGENTAEQILQGFENADDSVTLRVNTLKTTREKLLKDFEKQGISATVVDICDTAIKVKSAGDIRALFGYKQGLFHVQDVASQLCAKAMSVEKNMRVLDVCAAPGGKSFSIAEELGGTGEVVSCDKYEQKVKMIANGASRLELKNITTLLNDAQKVTRTLGRFDRVLCDLPCSGLGIMAKKPEIRYKNVGLLDNLPKLQYDLLCSSSEYVKSGGMLIFSTCTLRRCENEQVYQKFLETHPDFEPCDVLIDIERVENQPMNMLTLFPHIHNTDGFFISAFKKKG